MKHLFIINPAAGKGKALSYVDKINNIFKNRSDEYEIVITEREGHAIEVVRDRVEREQWVVYSIGGDGTLNEVLNGIINSDSTLGIIPAGSGNDFARTIINPKGIEELLQDTIRGSEQYIDVAKFNDRYYINIASVGLDAVVADNAGKYKKRKFISGPMAYIIGVIEALIKFKSIRCTFEVNGETFEDEMYLIAAANGRSYGGGLKIAPLADISDGMLDVYAIRKPALLSIISFIFKILRGRDTSSISEVKYIRCKSLKVKSEKEVIVNIDGELQFVNEMNFEIVPKAIKVMIPKKYEPISMEQVPVVGGENLYETI